MIDPAFGNWLAGFIDGEGCFLIRKVSEKGYYCGFSMELRLDDAAIIREIHERTGIGTIKMRARPGARGNDCPQISWNLQATGDCLKLAAILDEHPLRAKKRRDYAIWRVALDEQAKNIRPRGPNRNTTQTRDVTRMKEYREALRACKKYNGGSLEMPRASEDSQLALLSS